MMHKHRNSQDSGDFVVQDEQTKLRAGALGALTAGLLYGSLEAIFKTSLEPFEINQLFFGRFERWILKFKYRGNDCEALFKLSELEEDEVSWKVKNQSNWTYGSNKVTELKEVAAEIAFLLGMPKEKSWAILKTL